MALSHAGQGFGSDQHAVARQALALCPVLIFIACQQSLPTAPSELTAGIAVYEHADYLGESAYVTRNIADLKDVNGPCIQYGDAFGGVPPDITESWDDCISSVRLAPGWRAIPCGDKDFEGLQDQDSFQFVSNSSRCDSLTLETNHKHGRRGSRWLSPA